MVNAWSFLYDEILTMDETIDDGMRPWGHSDYEFLINNPNMTDTITGSIDLISSCLLYTSPSPRDRTRSRMPSSA